MLPYPARSSCILPCGLYNLKPLPATFFSMGLGLTICMCSRKKREEEISVLPDGAEVANPVDAELFTLLSGISGLTSCPSFSVSATSGGGGAISTRIFRSSAAT